MLCTALGQRCHHAQGRLEPEGQVNRATGRPLSHGSGRAARGVRLMGPWAFTHALHAAAQVAQRLQTGAGRMQLSAHSRRGTGQLGQQSRWRALCSLFIAALKQA